jgi:hypothetical protein
MPPRKLSLAKQQRKEELDRFNEQLRKGDAVPLGKGTTRKQRQNYKRAMTNIPYIASNLNEAAHHVKAFQDATKKHRAEEAVRSDDLAFEHRIHMKNRNTHRERAQKRMRAEAQNERKRRAAEADAERVRQFLERENQRRSPPRSPRKSPVMIDLTLSDSDK